MTLVPWLRRHRLSGYFALTYGISWGSILILFIAGGLDLAALQPLDMGLIFLMMLLGPSTSGLALTAPLDGRAGLRRLLESLMRWRVDVLVDFRSNFNTMGIAWLLEFAVLYLATLTPYRVLMTWVYANTKSLLLAVLMHASYTGWLLVLFPATSFEQGLLWQAAFATGLWVMVAVVFRKSAPRSSTVGADH